MGEGISLTPLYRFHPLHRHFAISRAIAAESSPFFKGRESSIDLILTNRKCKYTSAYDLQNVKSSFINIEPNLLNYRDYKDFNFENFKGDLSEALLICRNLYDEFGGAFITAL